MDPVGVGASAYRLVLAKELLAMRPTVIRANADEILALAGAASQTGHGVDSVSGSAEALQSAQHLADKTGSVVVLTGETDFILSAGVEPASITGGNAMSREVTGLGCATTALVAALLAVAAPRDAAIAGAWLMKAAAAAAGRRSSGPAVSPPRCSTRSMRNHDASPGRPGDHSLRHPRSPDCAGAQPRRPRPEAAEAGVDILQYRAKEAARAT